MVHFGWPSSYDEEPEKLPEASGSAMVAYAMIMEVKKGWLDAAEYGLVAWKVWKLFRKEVCFWGVRDRPLFYGHS